MWFTVVLIHDSISNLPVFTYFSVERAVQYCLFLHGISLTGLGASYSVPFMLSFLVLLSAAASGIYFDFGYLH
jgi:hypothetical protein